MEYENILAIDIGGTSVKLGVVNGSDILENQSVRNIFKGKPDTLLAAIYDICKKYIDDYNIKKIGIGCPGEIDNGVVLWASNLGWHQYNIKEDFKNHFPGLEVIVDNDGNAACQAEIIFGNLAGVNDGLFVTFGRGIGGAIIIDKQIIHGVHNRGGNFGHMVTHTNGRRCNCGRRGCFETYASVLGLIQTVREFNLKWPYKEDMIDAAVLSGYKIVEYNRAKNPVVVQALKKWNNDIAEGLLDLCLILDPSIIVMAGGITDSGLVDLQAIKDVLAKHGYDNLELKLASFKGKTGLVGAGALYLNNK